MLVILSQKVDSESSYLIQLKKDIPKTENVQKIRICIL